ncbi:MAG: peptidylprolyl isomerase [Candidatus Lloydbacteria bacterium]|nr:peptidylprolyl isomerase [Candidatus Lloydbacteria bacterium]
MEKKNGIHWGVFLLAVVVLIAVFFLGYIFKNVSTEGEKNVGKELASKTTISNGVIIKTNFGNIELSFFPDKAPVTVGNFIKLSEAGFYNGTLFHRVIKDFMIQGGDPLSKQSNWALHGTGGPGYTFQDEINDEKLVRGVIAMANAGPNTNGSQFFIVTAEETPWLDGKHTVFGRVVSGMDVVDKISSVEVNEQNHPLQDVVIEQIVLK